MKSKSRRSKFLVGEKVDGNTTYLQFTSVHFISVAQSCPTLCDPMNCSTPGLPVHHQLPKFTQTHIRRVSDAIQPSHPLSSPSPPAPNPSQHQPMKHLSINLTNYVQDLYKENYKTLIKRNQRTK